jgi:hypothetical protein
MSEPKKSELAAAEARAALRQVAEETPAEIEREQRAAENEKEREERTSPEDFTFQLSRIAAALERIAAALERR